MLGVDGLASRPGGEETCDGEEVICVSVFVSEM